MEAAFSLQRGYALEDVSDTQLLAATRGLVGRSNQLLAALLAHLAEVEARGVHRERACASLYTYCIYELRFSEDEAFRRVSLSDLHLRALRSFVTELKRKKCAVVDKPRSAPAPRQRDEAIAPDTTSAAPPPRQRGRHAPASVRRTVYQRDQARCTHIDDAGRRCCETHWLELHHIEAFAGGGAHTPKTLTLRCVAHNALAAEHDFGRAFMAAQRASAHESFNSQCDHAIA